MVTICNAYNAYIYMYGLNLSTICSYRWCLGRQHDAVRCFKDIFLVPVVISQWRGVVLWRRRSDLWQRHASPQRINNSPIHVFLKMYFSKCISLNASPQRINNSPIHVGSLHGAYRNAARVAKCHGSWVYI